MCHRDRVSGHFSSSSTHTCHIRTLPSICLMSGLILSTVAPIIALSDNHYPILRQAFPTVPYQSMVQQVHSFPVACLYPLFYTLHTPHDFLYGTRTPCLSNTPGPDYRLAGPRSPHPACWSPNPPLLLVPPSHLPGDRPSTNCGTHLSDRSDARTRCHPLLFINFLNLKMVLTARPNPLTTEILSI